MKDRSAPFSRKHRRYWFTVTGGMFIIMTINVLLGWWVLRENKDHTPPAQYQPIPPSVFPVDAGVDAVPMDGATETER